jgi:cell division protein FtsL
MDRGFVGWLGNRVPTNVAGIKAAPEAFLLLIIITLAVSYLASQRSHNKHVAVLDQKIAEREALLTDYRSKLNGASPQQAANEIEKLTKTLADAQRDLNEAKTKAASVNVKPRDPRSLYDEDNPIAAVRDPKIDLNNKKITFPVATSSVILGINKSYQFQNWKLACGSTQVYNTIRNNGAAPEFSYAPLTCKIVGNR